MLQFTKIRQQKRRRAIRPLGKGAEVESPLGTSRRPEVGCAGPTSASARSPKGGARVQTCRHRLRTARPKPAPVTARGRRRPGKGCGPVGRDHSAAAWHLRASRPPARFKARAIAWSTCAWWSAVGLNPGNSPRRTRESRRVTGLMIHWRVGILCGRLANRGVPVCFPSH